MRWHPKLDPEREPEGRHTAAGLPLDRIPQVQPELFALRVLIFQPEVVAFLADTQTVARLKPEGKIIR